MYLRVMKKLVVLSGAGMSAESGINTFRDAGGLWEGHNVMDVASPMGWQKNRELVLDFYNQRRRQLHQVEPNAGHYAVAELEKDFDVHVITQNVDDLHERAGSTNVIHLHGELFKVRSIDDPDYILDWTADLNLGDVDPNGNQLRPHIVWFGEAVPMMDIALDIADEADIFIVVGTSLNVYPAAGLVYAVGKDVPVYVVDPNMPAMQKRPNVTFIQEPATVGLTELAEKLLAEA